MEQIVTVKNKIWQKPQYYEHLSVSTQRLTVLTAVCWMTSLQKWNNPPNHTKTEGEEILHQDINKNILNVCIRLQS